MSSSSSAPRPSRRLRAVGDLVVTFEITAELTMEAEEMPSKEAFAGQIDAALAEVDFAEVEIFVQLNINPEATFDGVSEVVAAEAFISTTGAPTLEPVDEPIDEPILEPTVFVDLVDGSGASAYSSTLTAWILSTCFFVVIATGA